MVVELKAGEFEPKDAGQLNFYLTVVDKTLKKKEDNPSIGILLVKTKDNGHCRICNTAYCRITKRI